MTELTAVKIIITSQKFFYVIPNELHKQFDEDASNLDSKQLYLAFHDKYDKYKVFGDLNQIQFFAHIKA